MAPSVGRRRRLKDPRATRVRRAQLSPERAFTARRARAGAFASAADKNGTGQDVASFTGSEASPLVINASLFSLTPAKLFGRQRHGLRARRQTRCCAGDRAEWRSLRALGAADVGFASRAPGWISQEPSQTPVDDSHLASVKAIPSRLQRNHVIPGNGLVRASACCCIHQLRDTSARLPYTAKHREV